MFSDVPALLEDLFGLLMKHHIIFLDRSINLSKWKHVLKAHQVIITQSVWMLSLLMTLISLFIFIAKRC